MVSPFGFNFLEFGDFSIFIGWQSLSFSLFFFHFSLWGGWRRMRRSLRAAIGFVLTRVYSVAGVLHADAKLSAAKLTSSCYFAFGFLFAVSVSVLRVPPLRDSAASFRWQGPA
jgi:hypothetical protein